jgi:hypothetical protein
MCQQQAHGIVATFVTEKILLLVESLAGFACLLEHQALGKQWLIWPLNLEFNH